MSCLCIFNYAIKFFNSITGIADRTALLQVCKMCFSLSFIPKSLTLIIKIICFPATEQLLYGMDIKKRILFNRALIMEWS